MLLGDEEKDAVGTITFFPRPAAAAGNDGVAAMEVDRDENDPVEAGQRAIVKGSSAAVDRSAIPTLSSFIANGSKVCCGFLQGGRFYFARLRSTRHQRAWRRGR